MLTFGSFFSGIGLLDYGLHLAGIEHAWFCEADPWRREILKRRWPGRPVYDDIRNVGADTAVRVDGIVGGFPCKGASTAGKQTGFDHPETVLWREMARAVRELRPRYVVVENVAHILALHDGAVWGEVLGDLAALGFDVEWDCLPAAAVGAPHLRDRVFAVASHPDSVRGAEEHKGAESLGEQRSTERGRAEQSARVGGHDAALERRLPAALPAAGQAPAEDARVAPDAHGELRQARSSDAREERSGRCASGGGLGAAPDADRDGVREQPEPESRGCDPAVVASTRGVAVDWGVYRSAIRRWEGVRGPAPEPLVRRMDDRDAARLERSRLSALGDGVQVQVGQLVGAYILEREGRLAA